MRGTKELTIESSEDFPDAVLVRPAWASDKREPVRYVPVVRCRDCEHFDDGYTDGVVFGDTVCWKWGDDCPCPTSPDGYCHKGERMEGR